MADGTQSPEPPPSGHGRDGLASVRIFDVDGRLLLAAAGIGVVAAIGGAMLMWGVELAQEALFEHLPNALGFAQAPWWWPLPMLVLGATIVVIAQRSRPGTGASPLTGFHFDTPARTAVVALAAAIGSLAFGYVLGPEAALILIGTTIGALAARALGRGDDANAVRAFMLLGGVAAIGDAYGSPFITAFIVLEIAAFGGLPAAILVPSLVAMASGFLVQIGIWAIPGIGTHALAVPGLPRYDSIGPGDLLGGTATAIVAAVVALGVLVLGRRVDLLWRARPTLTTYGGAAVTAVAVLIAAWVGINEEFILFSGNASMQSVISQTSVAAVAAIVLLKAVAYSAALGAGFRGGPVFPATFLGVGIGVAGALLVPALAMPALVAAGIAASCAAIIRLPTTSALLAFLLVGGAGPSVTPLAIIGAIIGAILRRAFDAAGARKSGDSAPAPAH